MSVCASLSLQERAGGGGVTAVMSGATVLWREPTALALALLLVGRGVEARAALHGHDDDDAAQLAKELLAAHPQSRFAKDAAALVERLRARVQTDARAIGVILPLSGEYAAYGKRALIAIRLAFGVTVAEDKPAEAQLDPTTGEALPPKKKDDKLTGTLTTPVGLSLIVKDSAGRPETAQRAVRELVEKDHVIAVLGDILVDTSLPIAL